MEKFISGLKPSGPFWARESDSVSLKKPEVALLSLTNVGFPSCLSQRIHTDIWERQPDFTKDERNGHSIKIAKIKKKKKAKIKPRTENKSITESFNKIKLILTHVVYLYKLDIKNLIILKYLPKC